MARQIMHARSATVIMNSPLRHAAGALAVSAGFAYVSEAEDQFHRSVWFVPVVPATLSRRLISALRLLAVSPSRKSPARSPVGARRTSHLRGGGRGSSGHRLEHSFSVVLGPTDTSARMRSVHRRGTEPNGGGVVRLPGVDAHLAGPGGGIEMGDLRRCHHRFSLMDLPDFLLGD
jgi:hypothetical protein